MREILFRGQLRRKGEKVWLNGEPVESKWVYGGVCQFKGERSIIYQIEPDIEKFPVYTETVGQYTGLTDKNGRKIFEGDIVDCYEGEHYHGYYEVKKQVVVKDITDGICVFLGEVEFLEVIGNVHDNPELLKGKER